MANSKFKRFTFREKQGTDHKVNGESFRFYPNRMAHLEEARLLSLPVVQAVSILFADESRDSGSAVKRQREGSFSTEEIQTEPITIEMAAHRQAERDRAIDTIFGALGDKRSLILLGHMFMDSLRDEFPYQKDRTHAEVEEFLYGSDDGEEGSYEGLDLPIMISLFQGWMKGNQKVFGSVGEQVVGLVQKKLETAELSLVVAEPTSGEPSKTPSSPQSDSDSLPST